MHLFVTSKNINKYLKLEIGNIIQTNIFNLSSIDVKEVTDIKETTRATSGNTHTSY